MKQLADIMLQVLRNPADEVCWPNCAKKRVLCANASPFQGWKWIRGAAAALRRDSQVCHSAKAESSAACPRGIRLIGVADATQLDSRLRGMTVLGGK